MATALASSLHGFLEKTKWEQIVRERFFSTNNNAAFVDNSTVFTVTVLDETRPVAFGAFHVCGKNQAYVMLSQCDPAFTHKYVAVEAVSEENSASQNDKGKHKCLKIIESSTEDDGYALLASYYAAFADRRRQHVLTHVYEELVRMTLRTVNMDLGKNITVDFFESDLDETQWSLWRDQTGFVVSDNSVYYDVSIKKPTLLSILDEEGCTNESICFEELSAENEDLFQDYDSVTSLFVRQDYIDFLLKIKEISGLIALDQKQPVGYALALNNRILQCYAETESIANELIARLATKMNSENVSLFVRGSRWLRGRLQSDAISSRRVHRLHTRVVPPQIKWQTVFVLNNGLHLY